MTRRPSAASSSLVFLLALAAGCGTTNTEPPGNALPTDTKLGGDVSSGDVLFQFDTGTSVDTVGSGDTQGGQGDVAGADTSGTPVCDGAGGFNCPCTKPDDCDTGLCVQGGNGKICTKPCETDCPGGFKCAQDAGSGDSTFMCIPIDTTLCQPCEKDSDCDHSGIDKGSARCLPQPDPKGGTHGSFCTTPCGNGVACPGGYTCQTLELPGGTTSQCVPNAGKLCSCNPWGKLEGATTTCSVHNSEGTCWGTRLCEAQGLSLCSAATPTAEACNMQDDDCDGDTDEGFTVTMDGATKSLGQTCGSGACVGGLVVCAADGSEAVCDNSGKNKPEQCNFVDDDCDGKTDEDLDVGDSTCKLTGVCSKDNVSAACKSGSWTCEYSAVSGYEGATETSCDGKDNDCDGLTDEHFVYGVAKAKAGAACDGVGACGAGTVECATDGKGVICSTDAGGSQSQASTEVCDGLDNDCDGLVDEGCDDDVDGHCDKDMTIIGQPAVCKVAGLDCNDDNKTIYPGAPELCNDIDDDCNGVTDNGCDKDGDGVCDDNAVIIGKPAVCSKGQGDCNDGDKTVSPVAPEQCNGVDDDCDGKTDAADAADLAKSAPNCENQKGVCKGATKPVALCSKGKWGPCNDSVYLQHDKTFSNAKAEAWCDDKDNSCNGTTDEGCNVDGDPYCTDKATTVGKPKVCKGGGGDCDDKVKTVHPGAKEVCDAKDVDENCNGKAEEEGANKCDAYYYDGDADGFGYSDSKPRCLCAPDVKAKYTSKLKTDCDDKKAKVNPKAKETCATSFDDDCDDDTNDVGATGCTSYYTDADGDGYGDKKLPPVCMCAPKPGLKLTATKGGDCADLNNSVNPGKQESCLSAADDNCNGDTNDINALGCSPYHKDADGDGHGVKGGQPLCLCLPHKGLKYTASKAGDCDDSNGAVKPGVKDNCVTAGIDDNCDGKTDQEDSLSCQNYYYDGDGDGYGVGGSRCLCGKEAKTKYTAKQDGDCNDKNTSIRPGAKEVCNGIDDNCNNKKDDGATATCAAVKNASVACKSPSCAISSCKYGYFDLDKSYSNGCECGADGNYGGKGNACNNPIIVSTLIDTQKKRTYVSGNLMPGEAGQWYRVYMQDSTDSGGCDNYDVRIRFTQNPGSIFRMDVYRGSCSGTSLLCKDEATEHRYRTDFYSSSSTYGTVKIAPNKQKGDKVKSPWPIRRGECKCTTSNASGKSGPGLPGYNMCKSQSAYYYINVHYKAGVGPTCANFQLELSNGYY